MKMEARVDETISKMMPQFKLSALANAWFVDLPETTRKAVQERMTEMRFQTGDEIYSRGNKPTGMYCCYSGYVQLSSHSRDNRETIFDYCGPGTWFGETSTIGGLPRMYDAIACENSRLGFVDLNTVEDLLDEDPVFARALGRLISCRITLLLRTIESYSTQSAEHHLANRLLMLDEAFGRDDPCGRKIRLSLSQQTLAEFIGATRQRVSQILGQWEGAGIIQQRHGRICIQRSGDLQRIAQF
jgi:CRP-like cAMP-binding protein